MKLRRWLLWDIDTLVAVKSWWPRIDWDPRRKRIEILGPLTLTDRAGRRTSGRLVWDWAWLKSPWMNYDEKDT